MSKFDRFEETMIGKYLSLFFFLKALCLYRSRSLGADGVAQQLKAHAALAEDLSLLPSIQGKLPMDA